jgi:hypothetical protein
VLRFDATGEVASSRVPFGGVRPRRPPEPLELHPRDLADDEEYVAYRVVLTDDPNHPDFVESFKSRHARGLPPRSWTVEGPNPELAAGISAYRTRDAADQTARKAADRALASESSSPNCGSGPLRASRWRNGGLRGT